jgi:hypothetical protein
MTGHPSHDRARDAPTLQATGVSGPQEEESATNPLDPAQDVATREADEVGCAPMVLPRFSLARAALAAGFLASTGCSIVVKTDAEQCGVTADCTARGADFASTVCVAHVCLECGADADCTARGPQFANSTCVANVCETKADPKWGCIGHVDPPKGGMMIKVTIKVVDLVSTAPVTSATVKLCSKYDPPCNSPLGIPTVGSDGTVTATIASDFQGYFDVQAKGYLTSLAFVDATVTNTNSDIQLIPQTAGVTLAKGAGVTIDPGAGIILARTTDCTGSASAGVSVSIFPSVKETGFYTIAAGVSPGATATDNAGNAGFVNVAPGTPTLTATRGPGGQEIGKVTTLVRAGAVTYQLMSPTPTP